MLKTLRLLLPVMALMFGLGLTTANAAPAASSLTPLKSAAGTTSLAEKTYWVKRCHRVRRYRGHYGRVVCRRVWVRPYRQHYRSYGRSHRRGHYRTYRRYR